jgi:hypothetical protein
MNEMPEVPAPVPRRRRTGLVAVSTLGTVGIAAGVVLGIGAASVRRPGRRPSSDRVLPRSSIRR